MSKACCGLGGAPDINTFVERQIERLKKCSQTFESVFEFVFLLEDNIMAEYTDGNRIYKVTYGECKNRIAEISYEVRRRLHDIPKGALVGMHMDNCVEWIQIFWALLRNGYVPLLMNKRLGKEQLENVLAENNVCAVISDDEAFSVATIDYTEICSSRSSDVPEARWADEVIFMTSGTSARTKLCVYTGEKICRQIYNTKRIIRTSKEIQAHTDGMIKQLTFLPFYHVFGFLACYMWFAFFARTFVFLKNYHSDTILKTIRKHKVTHIFAVPMLWTKIEAAALQKIAERGEKTKKKFTWALDLSQKLQNINNGLGNGFARLAFKEVRENIFGESVRFMISGGGAISGRTLSFFNGIGYRLVNGYGMTEIGIASVEMSRKPSVINTASVGKPFDSVEYKTVNGELAVRASSMADSVIVGGRKRSLRECEWFMTEDMAEINGGQLYLRGRKDDLVVSSSGENIRPEIVEDGLELSGSECVLLGIPTKNGTIRSELIVSAGEGTDCTSLRQEVISQLREKGLYRFVENIRITREPLIKGSEFKLSRRRIREDIINGRMAFVEQKNASDSCGSDDELRKRIASAFEKALGTTLTEQQYDANFFYELEGTSLAYFEMVEEIRRDFGVNIIEGDNTVFYSVNDIYKYLAENRIKV